MNATVRAMVFYERGRPPDDLRHAAGVRTIMEYGDDS